MEGPFGQGKELGERDESWRNCEAKPVRVSKGNRIYLRALIQPRVYLRLETISLNPLALIIRKNGKYYQLIESAGHRL